MAEQRNYKLIYMLPSSMDEQAVDEFNQKFETEVNQHAASVISITKNKHQMVRTKVNKGVRNVYLISVHLTSAPNVIQELERYLKLTQGTVINYLILKQEQTLVEA